jgi:hypothetical protein
VHVQAVDEADLKAALSEVSRNIEESQGFGPEIIGSKIVDPGIDEDE